MNDMKRVKSAVKKIKALESDSKMRCRRNCAVSNCHSLVFENDAGKVWESADGKELVVEYDKKE